MIIAKDASLEIALWYFRMGFAVIPIVAATKAPPRDVPWKRFQTTRPTEEDLRWWFKNRKGHGLAVILGDVSGGLVCRDFDDMAAYEAWTADNPDLAKTLPTVETGRPGRHVYCRADIGQIRATSGTGAGIIGLGDGELRGGGYCVVPPSRHPSGHVYRWIVPLDANGSIPFLDLLVCGFLKEGHATENNREYRDNGGQQRTTEAIKTVNGQAKPSTTMASVPSRRVETVNADVERAITASLPSRPGRRNDCVFELTRALKAIPCLADTDPRPLEGIVREWHRRSLPFISTKPFEETWIDFLRAWPRVKYPKGTEPMAQLFATALRAELPQAAARYEQPKLRLLVALCRELQRAAGDGPFYLSVRTAAKLLGVDPTTASRWLFLLDKDDILDVVTRGDQKQWKASRYRYVAKV